MFVTLQVTKKKIENLGAKMKNSLKEKIKDYERSTKRGK
jgi:hypothetical protein